MTSPEAALLEMTDVTRVDGAGETAVHALRGVSLRVTAGEMVAVMGPSGSGKSTLLTLAGGLDTPTSGRVFVDGVELGSLNRKGLAALRRGSAGYVFQDLNLSGPEPDPRAHGRGERRVAPGARRCTSPPGPAGGACRAGGSRAGGAGGSVSG